MKELNYLFIWIAIIGIISYLFNTVEVISDGEHERTRENIVVAFIAFFPIFLLAGIGKPSTDVPIYLKVFHQLPDSLWEIEDYLNGDSLSGAGFTAFGIIIKRIFGDSEIIYRIAIGVIHSIPIVWIIRKYSDNYMLSLFLFLAGGYHLAWMMNGLRQFMAVTIVFMATPLLINKRLFLYIMIVLLSATIHTTALFMIPVAFIVQGKAFNKKTLVYIVIAVVGMYLLSRNPAIAEILLQGTEYEGVITEWQALGDNGVNPIRVLVSSIPPAIALLGRQYVQTEDDPVINIFTNMSVITLGLYLIGMVTSGITVGRMPVYTGMYNLILLPYLVNNIFEFQSARVIKFLMIIFYMVYYRFVIGF